MVIHSMKPDWKDYVALFIAALETIAIPFLLIIIAILIVYALFYLWF
jgi:hypothetical protein